MLKDSHPEVRLIPGYELLRPIGRGGMGIAYLAKQLSLGRQVVIKFLAPAPDADPAEQADRFRREAELMASISHPNVTTIFDFGIDDGHPFLVMEYVEGGDLRGQMEAGKPLPVGRVRDLLRRLVRALEFVHRRGILHRDLKPENILIDREDTPKVTDFGIAVPGTSIGSITRSGYALGTMGYVAPEQQYRLPVDERADQYSLAALTYEMLTGHLPLGAFPPPSRLNREVHPSVDAVILRALSEERTDRFATLRAFGDALDRALAVPQRRRRLLVAVSALVFLALCSVGVLRPHPGRHPVAASPAALDRTPNGPATPDLARRRDGEGKTAEAPRGDGERAARREGGQMADRPTSPGRILVNSLGMTFVLIPRGEFLMGAPDADLDALGDEKPQHLVRIHSPFYLGAHEVTVGQFRVFVAETGYQTRGEKDGGGVFDDKRKKFVHDPGRDWRKPGFWRPQADDEPVVQVSWIDAHAFCNWLSVREGVLHRLPYEAEWEYACRAGSRGRWSNGDDLARVGDLGWVRSNAGFVTHPVGGKKPNAFGLFDMHGNVWEWCKDRYEPTYPVDAVDDPRGPPEGQERVLRGGSWDQPVLETTRSSKRLHYTPSFRYLTVGFRVRRALTPPVTAPRSP